MRMITTVDHRLWRMYPLKSAEVVCLSYRERKVLSFLCHFDSMCPLFTFQLLQFQDYKTTRRISGAKDHHFRRQMSDPSRIAIDLCLSIQINSFIESCQKVKGFPDRLKMITKRLLLERSNIPFCILYECHLWMKTNGQSPPPLWSLFRSSSVILPSPITPERNQDLDRRVNALRTKFANQEYNKMVENLGPRIAVPLNKEGGVSFCSELRCINKQLVMILNFVIIISAGFAFGYFIPEMIASKQDVSFTTRLVCALAVAFLVFFADLYFLLKNMNAVEQMA